MGWSRWIYGHMQSVSPLGWMETHVIGFRSLRAQHNSSPPDEGCETRSWMEAQNSKPTPKCKAATPVYISQVSHPPPGRDFGCMSFFFPFRFPVVSCSKGSRAIGPHQPLAPYLFRQIEMAETYAWGSSHRFFWANSQRNSGVENRLLPHITGMSTDKHFLVGWVTCVHWIPSETLDFWPQDKCWPGPRQSAWSLLKVQILIFLLETVNIRGRNQRLK